MIEQLTKGTAVLARSGEALAPMARSAGTGRYIEGAKVVSAVGSAEAVGCATAAGAAAAAGASASVVVLPLRHRRRRRHGGELGAAAVAELTLEGLERAIARIETRLRDDDLGALAAPRRWSP